MLEINGLDCACYCSFNKQNMLMRVTVVESGEFITSDIRGCSSLTANILISDTQLTRIAGHTSVDLVGYAYLSSASAWVDVGLNSIQTT